MGLASVFRDQSALAPEDATPRRRFEGDLAAGAELGLRGAQAGYYNLPIVGDPNAAAYAEAQAAGVPVQFRSSEDVDFLNPSQVVDYAQQQMGQLGVSSLPTLVGGGLGAGLARTILGRAAANLTEAELARRAATIGNAARGGATIASTGQQYGDMAGELRAQGKEPGLMTGGAALLGGLTDTFALEGMFKGLVASAGADAVQAATRSRAASVALGAAQGTGRSLLTEVPNEVLQEGLAIGNRAYYDPAYRENTDDMWNRAKETAIATAFGAGAPGAVSGTVGGMRAPLTPRPKTDAGTDGLQTSTSADPNRPPLGLPHLPDDFLVLPDGTTARRSQVEELIAIADAEKDANRAAYLRDVLARAAVDETTHRVRQEEEAARRTPGLMAANMPPALPAPPPKYDPYQTTEPKSLLERIAGEPTSPTTPTGDLNGKSQNAAEESTLPPNETGQRQEVLKPAGAPAPATPFVPQLDLSKRQPNSFKVTGAAAARDPSLSKTDPRLVEILRVAAETNPEFLVEAFSGIRAINPKHPDAIQHPDGKALDVTLVDRKTGAKYDGNYQSSENFDTYERFAQHAKRVQMQLYPELNDSFTWGGYFSGPKGKYGAVDLMHFDLRSRGVHAAAGGDWASGLNPTQRKLFPGAKSQGMGAGQVPEKSASTSETSAPATQEFLGRQDLPRGIRNNNPGNIDKREGINWDGTIDGPEERFVTFSTPEHGIRAAAKNIMAKTDRGIDTLRGLIYVYAPPNENDTEAYVRKIASVTGIDPNQKIDLRNQAVLEKLVPAIIQHENGMMPYSADQIQAGIVSAVTGKPVKAAGRKVQYTPEQAAAEAQELQRRRTAGEPAMQDTTLGRAIKAAQGEESDPYATKSRAPTDDNEFTYGDEGQPLTEKGRKYESTGEDIFRPARPIPEAAPNVMEGVESESTAVWAFTEAAYPGATVQKVDPATNKVSITFPDEQKQALGENEVSIAEATLEAFHSGKKSEQGKKILLQHANVLSKDSGKPIEIPVTRSGLEKIGRALNPGMDNSPASAYSAAVAGLTHLVYDKGFQPRGVDLSKINEANAEIPKLSGKAAPTVRTPTEREKGNAPSANRAVEFDGLTYVLNSKFDPSRVGRTVSILDSEKAKDQFAQDEVLSIRADDARYLNRDTADKGGQWDVRIPEALREPLLNVAHARTPEEHRAAIQQVNDAFDRLGKADKPAAKQGKQRDPFSRWIVDNLGEQPVDRRAERQEPTAEDRQVTGRVMGTARAEGQVPQGGGLEGETLPERETYEGTPLRTSMEQELTRRIGDAAARLLANPNFVKDPKGDTPEAQRAYRHAAAVNQAVRSIDPSQVEAPIDTPIPVGIISGTADLKNKGKARMTGTKRTNAKTQRATAQDVANAAELVKQDYWAEQQRQRRDAERGEANQEAGASNADFRTIEQDATEDQVLSAEAEAGRAEDQAAMDRRRKTLPSAVEQTLKGLKIRQLDPTSEADKETIRKENRERSQYTGANQSARPTAAKVATSKSTQRNVKTLEVEASRERDVDHRDIETAHKVSGGSTIRASGVGDKVVQFFSKALTDIGLEVPLRVTGKATIERHVSALQGEIDALTQSVDGLKQDLADIPEITKEQKAARTKLEKQIKAEERKLYDMITEQDNLIQAMEDSPAARVIYNDHYADPSRRTPLIIVSPEAEASPALKKVLAHELGHVVQRAWFDQLPSDLQTEILNELTEDGAYTEDLGEAFADKFMQWYERNERGSRIKQKQQDIESSGMAKALRQLVNALRRLWNNIVKSDRAFNQMYPKFDEFLRSTVGLQGKMKPINSETEALWRESLAQPYGGLPLRVADKTQFNDMSGEELARLTQQAASEAKARAARYVENMIGENEVAQNYKRRLDGTLDVMKNGAEFLLMAEGHRLRNSWGGIFKGWANIYAPEMGKALGGMQVIAGKDLHTRKFTGRIQNMVKRWRGTYRDSLVGIQDQVNALSEQERQELWENLRNEKIPAKTPLAKEIGKYFARVWGDLRRMDVEVGKLVDYFPKSWNVEMFADTAKRDEIVDRFTQVFKSRNELPVKDRVKAAYTDDEGNIHYKWHDIRYETAEAAAIDTYNRISRGEIDLFNDRTDYGADNGLRSSAFPNTRPRPFSEKEYAQFGLYDFLNSDINYVMQTYTNQAVRRMFQQMATGIPSEQRDARKNPKAAEAWKKRFEAAGLDPVLIRTPTAALDLLLAEGIKDGRIAPEEYEKAHSLVNSSLGMKNIGSSPRLRRWTNRIVAYQTILTMGWSMFSSLGDFGIAAWRGESFGRASEAFGKLLDKTTRQQQEELLKMLGLAMDETTRHALQSDTVMANDPMAKGSHRLMERFFKLNGMEFLSHSNMIFSSLLGQSYIKDYANQAVNGATEKERADAIKRLNLLHPSFNPIKALSSDFTSDPMMQTALMEFISQAHLHDQQGYTPEYFQDYRFRLLTMLKGFTFKYHNIVLKQMWEKMKDQPDLLRATMPVITLALATMPLALLGMETKDYLRRKLLPKVKRYKEKSASEKFHDVVMASGIPGVYVSMFDDMLEAPKHGQPGIVSLAGPVVGTVYNMSARTADEYLPAMTPLVSSFPWARSKMREGLRDTFGFGVRDEGE